jgi:thioredoxin-dependent peroxiredoxin
MIDVGDAFPEYELKDENGELFKSSDISGVRYVLYFYSKDGTPGCTREAVEFSAAMPKFMLRNIPIVGVSKDSSEAHRRFIDKNGLRIKLLSDPDHVLMEAAGVWTMKKMYGKESMGTVRTTFIINKDGIVEAKWSPVKVDGHVDKVLEKAVMVSKKQM